MDRYDYDTMVVKGVYNHQPLYLVPYRTDDDVQEKMDSKIDYRNGDAIIVVSKIDKEKWKGRKEKYNFPEVPTQCFVGRGFFVGV